MSKYEDLMVEAKSLVEAGKSGTLSDDQVTRMESIKGEIAKAKASDEAIKSGDALIAQFKDAGTPKAPEAVQAKSLGDYFAKSAGTSLAGKRGDRIAVSAPEYKAASDVQVTGTVFGNALTSVDTNILTGVRRRLTIEDLLGSESISGTALTYFVESATVEGAFELVAENGQKPQLHFGEPTAVTEALSKIAGFIKESDELVEDLPFLKTAIDGRLLFQLNLFIENQLLNGSGAAGNLRGLLNRVGIQTEVRGSTAAGDNAQDTIFRAITKVETGSGLTADGIVISPANYQTLRLSKDANGQYFGGGFFSGQYGNGGIMEQPPLWGLRTIVTPAIADNTVLVGAFGQAGSVVSKGGIRVEATNTEGNDFTNNRLTIRAERRMALAVRQPAAFVKTTITPVA
jgi:HK97 family phage major capsid protein